MGFQGLGSSFRGFRASSSRVWGTWNITIYLARVMQDICGCVWGVGRRGPDLETMPSFPRSALHNRVAVCPRHSTQFLGHGCKFKDVQCRGRGSVSYLRCGSVISPGVCRTGL